MESILVYHSANTSQNPKNNYCFHSGKGKGQYPSLRFV